jgi:hypothetical protein
MTAEISMMTAATPSTFATTQTSIPIIKILMSAATASANS